MLLNDKRQRFVVQLLRVPCTITIYLVNCENYDSTHVEFAPHIYRYFSCFYTTDDIFRHRACVWMYREWHGGASVSIETELGYLWRIFYTISLWFYVCQCVPVRIGEHSRGLAAGWPLVRAGEWHTGSERVGGRWPWLAQHRAGPRASQK